MTDCVPVLLVTGPVGAGKRTVTTEAGRLLRAPGLLYAREAGRESRWYLDAATCFQGELERARGKIFWWTMSTAQQRRPAERSGA